MPDKKKTQPGIQNIAARGPTSRELFVITSFVELLFRGLLFVKVCLLLQSTRYLPLMDLT